MLWRLLTAAAGVLVGTVGVILLDCTYLFISLDGAINFCVEADLAVPGGSVVAGVVLTLAGLLMIGHSWLPHFVHRRKELDGFEEQEEAFANNVHRLPEELKGPVERFLPRHNAEEVVNKPESAH